MAPQLGASPQFRAVLALQLYLGCSGPQSKLMLLGSVRVCALALDEVLQDEDSGHDCLMDPGCRAVGRAPCNRAGLGFEFT